MNAKEFFQLNLNKIVIAKIIGIPLIVLDLVYNIFSYFQTSELMKVGVIILGSYLIACEIDFISKKNNRLDGKQTQKN